VTIPRRAWVRLNRLRTGVGRFRSYLYKWCVASCAVCECGAEEQPSTMLSSNVQSIDFPMDWTAWRFWTMRQLNGYSTPAPRSGAVKQWLKQQLAQTTKKSSKTKIAELLSMQTIKRSVEYANAIVDVTNSTYTNMLRCYKRDYLSFIHLFCSRRYT